MLKKILMILTSSILVVGCSSAPLKVDLSSSQYQSDVVHKMNIRALNIVNKATPGKLVNTMLGSDTHFPIQTAQPTRLTIENDIHRYFVETTQENHNSSDSVTVTIYKADAYWVWGGMSKFPIFGLLAVDSDTPYRMNLKILLEIENNGKVEKSYFFDEVIEIQASAATEKAIKTGYAALVAESRRVLFSELDERFISRYL
ncbi:hypothetical protein IOQ59_00525 [Pontibacterium sp. N1Y112]|uniref:Lipoprotein n=1 Tax=Pontibacterium sinense TaxID=2781979 RepID=A0A8J7K5L2_9GAMM|nr:hypothetical protein [Pontibacterium sinense]MBE9395741.1 hypothetical protein [Pontibacterium sinense]